MTTITNLGTKSAEWELLITRVFDAPREFVWKAWTDPERFMRWWGPKNFTSPVSKIELRVGGTYLKCMRSPEGRDFWSTGVYREIVPMERPRARVRARVRPDVPWAVTITVGVVTSATSCATAMPFASRALRTVGLWTRSPRIVRAPASACSSASAMASRTPKHMPRRAARRMRTRPVYTEYFAL